MTDRSSEAAWQRIRDRDPWRGQRALSRGVVLQIGRGRISAVSAGMCMRVDVRSSRPHRDLPPMQHVFWIPASALREMRQLPVVGDAVLFSHNLRLGVRAVIDCTKDTLNVKSDHQPGHPVPLSEGEP